MRTNRVSRTYEEMYGGAAEAERAKRRKPKLGLTSDQRFDRLYSKTESGCWLWNRCSDPNRYPEFHDGKGTRKASIYSLERKLGRSLAPGMEACHVCDVPRCVNPEHLFEGTHKDNMQDALRKGRLRGIEVITSPEVRAIVKAKSHETALKTAQTRRERGNHRGWTNSEETKLKRAEAMRAYWKRRKESEAA